MMIGPAPMIRMLFRSCRFGISLLLHQSGEAVEQVADVVRPGRGLRVTLEAERGLVGAGQALQRAVEQRDVGRPQLSGSVFSSTAKPWFWLVMLTRPLSRSLTGWLAPWWPNFILKVFAPEASARIWWPRQMPKVGMPRSISSRVAAIA